MVNETLTPESSELTIDSPALKLDFGCGVNKKEGFLGIDSIAFDGVDLVMDVCKPVPAPGATLDQQGNYVCGPIKGYEPWPWEDGSVDEAHASHFVEHLDQNQRVHFFNELYRVLKPGGQCQIVCPHWASTRAYGDPTHKWPALSEMFFYYLKADWRNGDKEKGLGANAPHTDIANNPMGFSCDFDTGWGYSMSEELSVKSQETIQFALGNYINAAQDTIATLTSMKPVPVGE